ncbi:MAG TPA: peptide deformylase [Gaiellaceae bacterium]|nr:peptide deformylase [Gaiellaceae bacterium]
MSEHAHDHEHDHDHLHEHEPEEVPEDVEAEARRQLALAQIRQYGDPALRMPAHEVDGVDEDVRRLAERMIGLMQDAQGVGLAATQVGVLRRVFVFVDGDDGPRVVVNPRVVEQPDETEPDEEGCLSLQGVRVPVERSLRLVVEGLDLDGKPVRLELEGYAARVVQHELDHLDGVLIIDRTDDEHRKDALRILRPRVVLR